MTSCGYDDRRLGATICSLPTSAPRQPRPNQSGVRTSSAPSGGPLAQLLNSPHHTTLNPFVEEVTHMTIRAELPLASTTSGKINHDVREAARCGLAAEIVR